MTYMDLYGGRRKNFTTMTATSDKGETMGKESISFVTQEGKDQDGNHVVVHEVVGDHPAYVQKTGMMYRSFSATVIVGQGDVYWEKEAEKFRAMCRNSSNQNPLWLEGMPQVPNTLCIIGQISNTMSGVQGVTVFNIVIYPIFEETPPSANYSKLLFDRLADMVDSWTDKVNDAFALVETTQTYIASVTNFFTSIADLLESGIQYIEFTADMIGLLKNPLALATPLKNSLKAYTDAVDLLVQTATPSRISNNPSIYYTQEYPYPNSQYSPAQATFMIKLSNLSVLTFLNSSASKISSSFIKFDDLINYRTQVLALLNNMISVLLEHDPAGEDLDQVYELLENFNGFFNTIYPTTSRGSNIIVTYNVVPRIFYFHQTGTTVNYEYFESDNNLQRVLYLEKGREVFLRDEYR